MPGVEARQIIGADEVEDLRVRMLARELLDRVDGERGRRPLQLALVDAEPRFARDRRAQHLEPHRGRRRLLVQLVRRDGCRDEDDFLELQRLQCLAREDQMRVMNRIERAAVDADLLHAALSIRSR